MLLVHMCRAVGWTAGSGRLAGPGYGPPPPPGGGGGGCCWLLTA